jgi:hypothetical protein
MPHAAVEQRQNAKLEAERNGHDMGRFFLVDEDHSGGAFMCPLYRARCRDCGAVVEVRVYVGGHGIRAADEEITDPSGSAIAEKCR